MDWLVVVSILAVFAVIGALCWNPFAGFLVAVPLIIVIGSVWGWRLDVTAREFVNKCHMAQNSVLTDEFKAMYCVDMRNVKFERFTG